MGHSWSQSQPLSKSWHAYWRAILPHQHVSSYVRSRPSNFLPVPNQRKLGQRKILAVAIYGHTESNRRDKKMVSNNFFLFFFSLSIFPKYSSFPRPSEWIEKEHTFHLSITLCELHFPQSYFRFFSLSNQFSSFSSNSLIIIVNKHTVMFRAGRFYSA